MNKIIFSEDDNNKWSKTLPGKMTSACLIIVHQNQVLMVKASYKDHWTFPSGIVDNNESPLDAAIRETKEETNLIISRSQCNHFCTVFTYSDGNSRDRFNFAFITNFSPTHQSIHFNDQEIEDYAWVGFTQVADKANYRGSYIVFQQLLRGELSGNYFENKPETSSKLS